MLEISEMSLILKNGSRLLNNINMSVAKGELVSVIGNNGAGKTTLLKTISGFFQPTTGSLVFNNVSINGWGTSKTAKIGIAHVPEGRRVFARENLKDNLVLGGYRRWWRNKKAVLRDAEEMIAQHPILTRHAPSQLAGNLSGGEQQVLAILRGLMMEPALLLLDEPSLGLSPLMASEIFDMIVRSKDRLQMGIVLVEQMAYRALNISDRGYVLDRGNIVAEGTSRELLSSETIRRAYLGAK